MNLKLYADEDYEHGISDLWQGSGPGAHPLTPNWHVSGNARTPALDHALEFCMAPGTDLIPIEALAVGAHQEVRFQTHTLWTADDPEAPTTVTEKGLSICKVCGAAESDLYDFECGPVWRGA